MITDTRALRAMPAALKPRVRPIGGWWRLTPPRWTSLRGHNTHYVSLSPSALLEHWANDVTCYQGEALPTLLYHARREYRSMQETLLHTGRL
jgi:hypothetical protein